MSGGYPPVAHNVKVSSNIAEAVFIKDPDANMISIKNSLSNHRKQYNIRIWSRTGETAAPAQR